MIGGALLDENIFQYFQVKSFVQLVENMPAVFARQFC
jgi:hypothetical protein